MKTKKSFLVALTAIFAALLMSTVLFKSSQNTTPESSPIDTEQTVTVQAASDTAISRKVQTSSSTKTTVNSRKHAAGFLTSNPKAEEIPYYLLGPITEPLYATNWSLNKIQAERAWDLTTGSSGVKVAVIDSGFALNHEELAGRWVVNANESGTTQSGNHCWNGSPASKQTNACDDDQNGYIDDWRGYDFYNSDNNPAAGTTNPDGDGTDHGTAVAGTLAASANNGHGTAGIDLQARIMPLQVFDDDGKAYTTDIVAAIEYAVDNGAKVINLSLGTSQFDALLLSVIQYARSQNVFVVAASGNCALNDESFCNNLSAPGRITYPALYSETFSVGATNSNDQRANYSSYGPELDIVAPGSSIGPLPIYTANNQISAYANASGTSFASPLAAGTASLLIAQNPSITPAQIDFILTESADRVSSMGGNSFTSEFGNGRLNAHKATLLGLAKTQDNLLGSALDSPRQPAIGAIWRSSSGTVQATESILVGCRTLETDICSVNTENGTINRYSPLNHLKGDQLHYIFLPGSSLLSGTSKLSVHNNEYATSIGSLIK